MAKAASSLALVGAAVGCQAPTVVAEEQPEGAAGQGEVGVVEQAQLADFAEKCGLDIECKLGGIAEGRANISGVASVDSFFSSVISFQNTALGVSADIDAEIAAIRADFGIAASADLEAELKAKFSANVEGSLNIEAEPARCQADIQASVQAKARCEAEVMPPKAMLECKGSCEVEANAMVKCEGSAELRCTATAPSIACMGECKGSCEANLMAAAACEGTCKGSCSGDCSAYADNGGAMAECAGKCNGMCTGKCEVELAAEAKCEGSCKGECTVTKPSGGCEGGIRAECKAEANAMVMCEGRCDGEITPPKASAECEASVKAEAKMNVQCTPPRLAINYKLKAAAGAELMAQARFVAAVENLKVRLPSLLAKIKRASVVIDAGADLTGAADGAIKGAAMAAGDANARVAIGLACAIKEVPKVGAAVAAASTKLQGSLSASTKLTAGLGL